MPVILEEIKIKAETDEFILKMKQIQDQKKQIKKYMTGRNTVQNLYLICNNVLMYAQWGLMLTALHGRMLKKFHTGHRGIPRMKSLIKNYVY